ncbi:MAG: TrkA family potassium uptake protein [Phycisphaerae bacterium]|jgi:trk system potassium uptake protein TrkA
MKQVCVIGLGHFGRHVAQTLVKMGCEVLVIDSNESRVQALRDEVHRALIGDVRDYQVLAGAVDPGLDEAIIALGQRTIEPSILCTLNLRRIGVEVIRSTANSDDHAQILKAVGATEIIFPERDAAERTARRVASPGLVDMFPLAEDYRIMEVVAPRSLAGKTLAELNLRASYDLLVLAVRRPEEEQHRFLPTADTQIRPGEIMMVMGRELDLVRFAES